MSVRVYWYECQTQQQRLSEVMEKTCVVAGSGPAADVTGVMRVCTSLQSRLDDFMHRVDNVSHTHECSQLIDKVSVVLV